MALKTYSRARTAEAAARAFCEKAGIVAHEIIRDEETPGFTCVIVAPEVAASTITTAGWKFRAAQEPELPQGLLDQVAETDLSGAPIIEEPTEEDEKAYAEQQAAEEAPAPVEAPKKSGYIHEASWLEKPTKKVWHIADSMPGAARKDVIAACREAGIAYGTARTQYQEWKKANAASVKK